MRADGIVREVLRDVEGEIHRARLGAVSAAVCALISGGQIGLAALGRAIGRRSHKHGIKRIDRLLGNRALVVELELIYAAIVRYVLRSVARPVILLDWTESGHDMYSLTAAVPLQGRAIAIYSVTVPRSQYTARRVENTFLDKLRTLLPSTCRPILVGDAGFRAPWMRRVQQMGWDFVVRVRGRTLVQRVGGEKWQHWKQLTTPTRGKAHALGTFRIVKQMAVEAQLVFFERRALKSAEKRRNARARRAARGNREPWLLATTLSRSANDVVAIYKARMQIELTFRDLKSHRFGWGFEDARCRSTARVAVQLMLVAVASLVVMLVGIAAEAAGMQKHYQANTIRKRRVLSLVALGRVVIRTVEKPRIAAQLRNHLPFKGIP